MSVNLNLASKPFNNRTLPWLLTVMILFASLIGLVIVVHFTTKARSKAAQVEAENNSLKQQEQSLIATAEQVKQNLTPQQRQSLNAAHQLVDRKSFSWSRLLADLEGSLPDSVRVSRIAVQQVSTTGNTTVARLDLAVFSKESTTITEMISSMAKAGIFEAYLVNQNLQKGRGESGAEYELDVIYRPRSGVSSEAVAEVQKEIGAASEERK